MPPSKGLREDKGGGRGSSQSCPWPGARPPPRRALERSRARSNRAHDCKVGRASMSRHPRLTNRRPRSDSPASERPRAMWRRTPKRSATRRLAPLSARRGPWRWCAARAGTARDTCFFQKHLHDTQPQERARTRARSRSRDGVGTYVVANSVRSDHPPGADGGVLGVAHLGVEREADSGAVRIGMIISISDPDPEIAEGASVVEGAHLTRALLHEMGAYTASRRPRGEKASTWPCRSRGDMRGGRRQRIFARSVAEHMGAGARPAQFLPATE
jgi:hypothetical protein